jgi:putative intracellular protease/amidase
MHILLVMTSHSELGETGEKTGIWIEEFAAPYYFLADAGVELTLASPKGGQVPIDPKSEASDFQTDSTHRFDKDARAQKRLATTRVLSEMKSEDFDAVFYPGGHGPLWDLTGDTDSIALIERFNRTGKVVSTVCHAGAVLLNAHKVDGTPLVDGCDVTGFSNSEEAAVGLTDVVPFLLEDELKAKGGNYQKGDDWASFVLQDGKLITGQNPGSSVAVAKLLLKTLQGA